MKKFDNIVLNIPHSSMNGIFSENSGWRYNANLINEMMKETDWHTDFIFDDMSNPKITTNIFPYSRFLVDAERLENDPLEKDGRGIIYTDVCGFKRDYLNDDERNRLLNLRKDYLEKISERITEDTFLVDCHSFNDKDANGIDICIGFNNDWSKPDDEIIDGIVEIFEIAGYKIGMNTPYSNSITPKPTYNYKSILIEVNKKLYLRNGYEINVDSNYAPRLTNAIKKVYDFVLS